jgi:hypothetical protein
LASFRRRGRRPRRWVAPILVGGAVALVVIGLLSTLTALGMRKHLERGRQLLTEAQDDLLRGEVDLAARRFQEAGDEFGDAKGHPGVLLLRLEGLLPLLGRTPQAVVDLAEIGDRVANAGTEVTEAIARLPEGLSSLGLRNGRLPLEEIDSIAPAVARARVEMEEAAVMAERLPDAWLLGPVAEGRDLITDRLDRAVPLVRAADEIVRSMPEFAGVDRPKRYFVSPQNSAELRGTGGLIGNFAILTITEGRISLSPFRDVGVLPSLAPSEVAAPSREFSTLYDQFGGAGFWLNINMTPDVPTAAVAIEALYERVRGERLDGSILLDLQGMSNLLEATGPVRVDELDVTLTPGNVVEFVANAGYRSEAVAFSPTTGPRLVAQAIWGRLLSEVDPGLALRNLISAAAEGHLVLHAADPATQRAFSQAGVAGEFGGGEGDFFGVTISNAAGNKVDYYLEQDVRYEVFLEPDGRARAVATVRLFNDAPAGEPPSYALGPIRGLKVDGRPLEPGENRSWISFYCAPLCELTNATEDGGPATLRAYREQGHWLFAGFVEVKPQRAVELRLSFNLAAVWAGDRAGGTYNLRMQGQPTIRPTGAAVVVHPPEDMDATWASGSMELRNDRATSTSRLGRRMELSVGFQKPLPARLWTRVWDFLTKPLIDL